MTTENILPFGDNLSPLAAGGALDGYRQSALDAYLDEGLPGPRTEAWKYTRLQPLESIEFRPSTAGDAGGDVAVPAILAEGESAARLVFVNGHPRLDLSTLSELPEGVSLKPVSTCDSAWLATNLGNAIDGHSDGLTALNAAGFSDGYALVVERGATVSKPIEVIWLNHSVAEPLAWFPRNLIIMGENSEATVVTHEASLDAASAFVNAVTEVTLTADSRLKLYGVNSEKAEASVVSRMFARLGRAASLEAMTLDHGAGLTRNESTVLLEGEGAEARLDGGYLLRGEAHTDNTTRIEHRVPNTTCNEVFKGVADDTARAVFQGKIVVCKDAQHTDGQMLNKTLLLSNKAEVDTKPELEIYADDVKCAHGATSGQIDETALFYLRSRGIPERTARNLLVRSFLGDVTERISNAAVRDAVTVRIERWLPDDGSDLLAEEAA